MALSIKMLLVLALAGGIVAGGAATQGGDDSVAKSLEKLMKRTADDAVEQLTQSPMRSASLTGRLEDGKVTELLLTVKSRGGAETDLPAIIVTLRTPSGARHAAMGSGPEVKGIRDDDRSIPDGRLNSTDLAEIRIPLAEETLGSRVAVDLLLQHPGAQPLKVHFETPPAMNGRFIVLEFYEAP